MIQFCLMFIRVMFLGKYYNSFIALLYIGIIIDFFQLPQQMFLILTKMSNFCITECNAGVLLRISPLKFNYDPAECSRGLQKAACLWQSLTSIWNNCM